MASVASLLGDTGALLESLLHTTTPPPLDSDISMLSSTVSGYDHSQHFGQPFFHGGVPLTLWGNPDSVPTVSGMIPLAILLPLVALPFPAVVPARL